jgi:hypothetical protein
LSWSESAQRNHALPVEAEAALLSGHRIVFFIERFLLLPLGPPHVSFGQPHNPAVAQRLGDVGGLLQS